MALWLLIGVVFPAALLLALWRGRHRSVSALGDQSPDPNESRRGADAFAADATRAAEARIAPNPGGFGF